MEPLSFTFLCVFCLIITILLCVIIVLILKTSNVCCFEHRDSRNLKSVRTSTDESAFKETNLEEHVYKSIPDIRLHLEDFYIDDTYSEQESLKFHTNNFPKPERIYFELEQEAECDCVGACNCNCGQGHFYD